MPVKPSERTMLREDNLRTTLLRKIDQKILDTPEGEPIVFHFRVGTPQLMAHSLAKEYAANGWRAEVRPETNALMNTLTGDPDGGTVDSLTLVLEPDDGSNPDSMSPAEEEMDNLAQELRSKGAIEVRWQLVSHSTWGRIQYNVDLEAIFCTSGSGSSTEGTEGRVTLSTRGNGETPETAALLCATCAMDTLEHLFLALSR